MPDPLDINTYFAIGSPVALGLPWLAAVSWGRASERRLLASRAAALDDALARVAAELAQARSARLVAETRAEEAREAHDDAIVLAKANGDYHAARWARLIGDVGRN